MTRVVLDHFTDRYVRENEDVIGARVLAEGGEVYLSVLARPGAGHDLPSVFEQMPLRIIEAVPGQVAAGPVR
jgi:hypothetical protein